MSQRRWRAAADQPTRADVARPSPHSSVAMDEEEPVDVKAVIDAKCSMTPACAKALVRVLCPKCVLCTLRSACGGARRGLGAVGASPSHARLLPNCAQVAYEMCGERIEAKGHGDCAGYFMDYVKCVDQCVRPASPSPRIRLDCSWLLAQRFRRSFPSRRTRPSLSPRTSIPRRPALPCPPAPCPPGLARPNDAAR